MSSLPNVFPTARSSLSSLRYRRKRDAESSDSESSDGTESSPSSPSSSSRAITAKPPDWRRHSEPAPGEQNQPHQHHSQRPPRRSNPRRHTPPTPCLFRSASSPVLSYSSSSSSSTSSSLSLSLPPSSITTSACDPHLSTVEAHRCGRPAVNPGVFITKSDGGGKGPRRHWWVVGERLAEMAVPPGAGGKNGKGGARQ